MDRALSDEVSIPQEGLRLVPSALHRAFYMHRRYTGNMRSTPTSLVVFRPVAPALAATHYIFSLYNCVCFHSGLSSTEYDFSIARSSKGKMHQSFLSNEKYTYDYNFS